MSAYITYESYLTRPEQHLTPAKVTNLMKIMRAINDDYMTMVQIRKATNLQTGQVYAAMDQYGMKVLFTGKGLGFALSPIGKDVIAGKRTVTMGGISKRAMTKLEPLTSDEFRKLSEDDQKFIKLQEDWLAKVILKLGPFVADAEKHNIKLELIRGLLWQCEQSLIKLLTQTSEPSTQAVATINGAKSTMGTIQPLESVASPE